MRAATWISVLLPLALAMTVAGCGGSGTAATEMMVLADGGGSDDGGGGDDGGSPDADCLDPLRFDNSDVCAPANSCACPDATPSGACTQVGEACRYHDCMFQCTCVAPESRWLCCRDAAPSCPATGPTEGQLCCASPPSCAYLCDGRFIKNCTCTDSHWVCQKTACSFADAGP